MMTPYWQADAIFSLSFTVRQGYSGRGNTAAGSSARGAAADHRQPAQHIDGLGQLLVARRADVLGRDRGNLGRGGRRHCIARRRPCGLVGIFERARQIGLAPPFTLRQFCQPQRGHDEIGFDALALDLPAGGCGKTGGGQPDRPAAAERDDALDRTLAKGLGAEQNRPVVVLQGSGDELGLARGAAVDERHHRQPLGDLTWGGADPLDARRFAPLDDDDFTFVEEGVGGSHRSVEGTARIVSQIENEADQLVARPLPEILHGVGKSGLGCVVEASDADITDIALFKTPGHRRELIRFTLDHQINRLFGAVPQGQLDLATGWATEFLLGLSQAQIVNRVLVYREDDVAWPDPGPRCRRSVLGRDDLELAAIDRDDEAGGVDIPVGRRLQRLELVLVHERGAWVEPGQHAGNGRPDQFRIGNRVDCVIANALEGFVEQIELFVDAVLAGLLLSKDAARDERHAQQYRDRQSPHPYLLPRAVANRNPTVAEGSWHYHDLRGGDPLLGRVEISRKLEAVPCCRRESFGEERDGWVARRKIGADHRRGRWHRTGRRPRLCA